MKSKQGKAPDAPPNSARVINTHCHRDGSFAGREGVKSKNGVPLTLIGSFFSMFSVCPDWRPPVGFGSIDESTRLDLALDGMWQPTIVAARQALLVRLDDAAKLYPRDCWVSAQRVRFRADAGQVDLALDAATECRAEYAFCVRLRGYVE